MKTFNDYLADLKGIKGWQHDTEIADWLGIKKQTLASIKKGKSHLDYEYAVRMAIELNIDVNHIMLAERIEHAKDDAEKKAWQGYFASIYGVAAGVATISIVTLILCHYSSESGVQLSAAGGQVFIM
jgi:DNA-binding XRE family transcriptional regulator